MYGSPLYCCDARALDGVRGHYDSAACCALGCPDVSTTLTGYAKTVAASQRSTFPSLVGLPKTAERQSLYIFQYDRFVADAVSFSVRLRPSRSPISGSCSAGCGTLDAASSADVGTDRLRGGC